MAVMDQSQRAEALSSLRVEERVRKLFSMLPKDCMESLKAMKAPCRKEALLAMDRGSKHFKATLEAMSQEDRDESQHMIDFPQESSRDVPLEEERLDDSGGAEVLSPGVTQTNSQQKRVKPHVPIEILATRGEGTDGFAYLAENHIPELLATTREGTPGYGFPESGAPSIVTANSGEHWLPDGDADTRFVFALKELFPSSKGGSYGDPEGCYGVAITRKFRVGVPPALMGGGEVKHSWGTLISKRTYVLITQQAYLVQHFAVLEAILAIESEASITPAESKEKQEALLAEFQKFRIPKPGFTRDFPLGAFTTGLAGLETFGKDELTQLPLRFTCPMVESPVHVNGQNELIGLWAIPALMASIPLTEILRILTCLLHGRSVVVYGTKLELVNKVVFGLMMMLHPFKWPFTFHPTLSATFLQALDSPTPVIAGVFGPPLADAMMTEGTIIISLDARRLDDIVDVTGDSSVPMWKKNKLFAALLEYHDEFNKLGKEQMICHQTIIKSNVVNDVRGVLGCLRLYYNALLDYLDDHGLGLGDSHDKEGAMGLKKSESGRTIGWDKVSESVLASCTEALR